MTKSFHVAGNINSVGSTANTTQYWNIVGGSNATATESNAQQYSHTAGTYSNFTISLENSASLSITLNLRKNGANANQTLSVSAGAVGVFSDTTHTDSVTVGDLFCVQSIPGQTTGSFWPMFFQLTFDATTSTDTVSKLSWANPALNATSFNGASTTYYIPLLGEMLSSGTAITTETSAQTVIRAAGTMRKLHIRLTTNARTTTSTLRFRKNAANGNGVVSVTSGQTGVLTDSTNTDTVAAGDKVNLSYVTGTGTLVQTVAYFGVEYVNTASTTSTFMLSQANSTAVTQAKSVTNYYTLAGRYWGATAVRYGRTKPLAAVTFHDLCMIVNTNGLSAASTLRLQVNDIDSALTVSIAATTGTFTDSTHTVTVTNTDTVNLALTTGTGSGTVTLTLGGISVMADYPPSVIDCTVTSATVANKIITIV